MVEIDTNAWRKPRTRIVVAMKTAIRTGRHGVLRIRLTLKTRVPRKPSRPRPPPTLWSLPLVV
jgi:hypothetical protein